MSPSDKERGEYLIKYAERLAVYLPQDRYVSKALTLFRARFIEEGKRLIAKHRNVETRLHEDSDAKLDMYVSDPNKFVEMLAALEDDGADETELIFSHYDNCNED